MNEGRSLRRADWELAAMTAMAGGGLAAVHIDDLAHRLGVTKGSFYWHYDSRDELIAGALSRWCAMSLQRLERLEALADPRDRLGALMELALGEPEDTRVEVALAGAIEDERVTPFVEAVTTRRLTLLEQTYAEMSAAEPRQRALLAHATYVGYLHTVSVDPARRDDPAGLLRLWRRALA